VAPIRNLIRFSQGLSQKNPPKLQAREGKKEPTGQSILNFFNRSCLQEKGFLKMILLADNCCTEGYNWYLHTYLKYILVGFTSSIIDPLPATVFIFLFLYMDTKYTYHIHPHSPFPCAPTPSTLP
jgi:hypothetical protein